MKHKILGFALGPIGAAALGFITLPLITWFYSVEDIGRISMLQVVVSFSVLLFCFGLDQAYIREYHESDNKEKLFKLSLFPGLVCIIFIFGIIYFVKPTFVSQYLYGLSSAYLSMMSIVCIVLSFISRFLSLILRMEDRAFAYSMSQLLPKILFLIFIVSTVWLGFKKDAYNLITANSLSIIAVFLVFTWNTRKEWIHSITHTIKWKQLKPLLVFGLPLVVGGLASWGLNVMDKLFLRGMSTFSELGVYSVAMSIAGVATVFSGIFNTIWAPMVFKWVKEGADLNKIDVISEHLLAVMYFIVVMAGLFSWTLPYFLPTEYAAIEYLMTLCLLGPLFYTLSETTAVGISISRKTGFSMLASIGAMLINAIGNYFLVPKIGATGAAISTGFSFWVFYILRTEFSRLVWRNIPSIRSYLVITVLLILVVISALFPKYSNVAILMWLSLLFVGPFIFRPTCNLIYKELHKLCCM